MADRFTTTRIDVGDVELRVRYGGDGPPLLLLHGYPETHELWNPIADALAEGFTVVAPDLRGYGESSAPATVADHSTYGKRAMARDAIALMRHLGFETFDVAGHDRGGRVGYRLALDRPAAVRRLTVLDIVPTGEVWARADDRFALGYWHWAVLAQPYPLPETLIAADPEWFFFDAQFGGAMRTFPAVGEYARHVRDPRVVHAICEDYRAGATCDRADDDADRAAGNRISCPVQVLWAGSGAVGTWYDPLAVWRNWADDVTGEAIESGHFIPEQNPAATLAALRRFHGTP
ncbi:alpha/beta fold hydrolase [Cryptosporangium arvum]|uniref:Putative hydrolase or acyltransferase of alpha/beta superfamily n=1 Tax=Cryptosporangium arvum DSM 44712 TaxID=927661 RepID=A0A010YPI5_9ACTN|nr:alpha/beta hydrolase [Cryptosporangium arvum]EXG82105.1 putative hydrolase or acyltransferase of alpha/beta superfamily [Cryptosporangium arvum DSM 44712]